jgi:hypothetical protein
MSHDEIAALLRALRDRRGVRRLLAHLGLGAVRGRGRRRLREPFDGRTLRVDRLATRRGLDAWFAFAGGVADAPAIAARIARRLRRGEPVAQQLVIVALDGYRRVVLGTLGLGDEFRHITLEPAHVRAADIEAVSEMVAADGEGGLALVARYARALDRERVGRRFFDALRLHRGRIAAGWRGVPRRAHGERAQLALLLLCRLIFLYFLQRRAHLDGDAEYFVRRIRAWRPARAGPTFYRIVLRPLFFGALNRRPERRGARARALGALPYLNGGLFERHALERRHRGLDLPDAVLLPLFGELLEQYRFTSADAATAAADAAPSADIDPEMLGRIFEGLMATDRRGDTGTFFTPPATADRIVRAALAHALAQRAGLPLELVTRALDGDVASLDPAAAARLRGEAERVRVLDPACGSGAFLLAALTRLAKLRVALGGCDERTARRAIVATSLYGVDVQADAALLCALRLWLALVDGAAGAALAPLPNLDRRIRQGDSLIDPLDLGAALNGDAIVDGAARDAVVRAARRALAPGRRYADSPPEQRGRLAASLLRSERRLARAWLAALRQRVARGEAELRAVAGERDLFGQPTRAALAASHAAPLLAERRRELDRWRRRVRDDGELPFFSYPIHFADASPAGFDVVIGNPPWVRAHRWPDGTAAVLRQCYQVCGRTARAGAGQVDLALLFLERAVRLCAADGVIGLIMPAKLLRSGYAAHARSLLLRETTMLALDDHALDQRAIFAADAYATTLIARRGRGDVRDTVRVRMDRRGVDVLDFEQPASELPLAPDDTASVWLLAPPDVRRVLRHVQQRGSALDAAVGTVRRGVVTGANDVLVVREAIGRLGDLVEVRCEGRFRRASPRAPASYEAIIERQALRPLLRGSDVAAWRAAPGAHVLWVLDAHGIVNPARRLARFLATHADRLKHGGRLQRLSPAALGAKLVWQDIATTLNAAVVPARASSNVCGTVPVVPLNTVYYVPVASPDDALVLAALLNSLPLRVYARAVAERAKDARFRFFAGTVARLPLPADWRSARVASPLRAVAARAHERGGITPNEQVEIDERVARAFALGARELNVLRAFDAWLSGGRS